MRKIFLLLSLVLCVSSLVAETSCYWVFFTDKANTEFNPYSYFDSKAIERRKRMGVSLYDISDYPLNENYEKAISELSDEVIGETRWFNGMGIMANDENIEKIKKFSFVKKVVLIAGEMEIASYKTTNPNNIDFFDEKGLSALKPKLYEQLSRMQGEMFSENNIDGKGVRIAVFDGGFPNVDKHEAFEYLRKNNQIIKTWNFPKKKENVYGWSSHGTMVLSCIAGIYEGKKMGLATGSEFLLARTEVDAEPFKEEVWWMQAMEWADKNGADVISSSLGYGKDRHYTYEMDGTSYVAKAANMAARKGMLVCNSMGNEADDNSWKVLITPADADSIISVGGIEASKKYKHIYFSSYGPTADGRMKPNVCAYGEAYTASPNGGINTASGTSFSCPLVAGFVACAWQTNRNLSAMDLKKEIEKSGDLFPYFDYAFGYGVPQAQYFVEHKKAQATKYFSFKKDGNELEIVFTPFDNQNEAFYNIQAPDGEILNYQHVEINDGSSIRITDIDKLTGCKLNVYYRGYVDTYNFSGESEIVPMYANIITDKVTENLNRTTLSNTTSKRKQNKTSIYMDFSFGFYGLKTIEEKTNSNSNSFNFSVGIVGEIAKVYKLCGGIGIGLSNYKVDDLENIHHQTIPKKEILRTNYLSADFFQRVRLYPGGIFSMGLNWDLGVYGEWNYSNMHYLKYKNADANENYKFKETIYNDRKYINAFQWGIKTSISYEIVSIYAKMRMSNLLDNSYMGTYSDMLKLEFGAKLTIPLSR